MSSACFLDFICTTVLKTAHTVQWLFKQCRDNGFVYPGHYTGQYCIYDNAYVDVKPGENCPDCGRPTETVTEANFYFKLSAFQKPLLDWYAKHPDFIQPEARRNEVLSFVEGGLRDLSITRTSVRWGIPVPGEAPHVFYVWFDALTAYLSALANALGSLASRTAAMIEKNSGGKIPKPAAFQPQDTVLATKAQETIGEVLEQYEKLGFSLALEEIWSLIAATDKYLTTEHPWSLGESEADQQRRATILWTTAEVLRIATALTHPVLPDSTTKVWSLLGQQGQPASVALDGLRWGQLAPGTPLGKSQALFPRIEKTEAIERMESMENEAQKQPSPVAAPATPSAPAAGGVTIAAAPAAAEKIGIEDFAKVEMRVGQIKTAERIVGADKLLKLTVDIGTESFSNLSAPTMRS